MPAHLAARQLTSLFQRLPQKRSLCPDVCLRGDMSRLMVRCNMPTEKTSLFSFIFVCCSFANAGQPLPGPYFQTIKLSFARF